MDSLKNRFARTIVCCLHVFSYVCVVCVVCVCMCGGVMDALECVQRVSGMFLDH